jgi:hypothetical protein
MLADVVQFIGDLLDHWVAFGTGSIPVMIIGIWERWRSRNVSFRFYAALFLAFGFTAASFQTWRQEHNARILDEQTILHSKERTATKAKLQTFYIEIGQMIDAPVVKDISADDFKKFADATNIKLDAMVRWITENMGQPAAARFLDRSGMVGGRYSNAVNDTHNTILMNENRYRQNLLAMIESAAWDK